MLTPIIASVFAVTAAQGSFEEACEAFQAEYGGEASCSCLAQKVEDDPELAEMLSAITSPADFENAPEKALEAVAECV